MNKVVLLVGVPASGKSTVCERLADRFHYVRHDDFIDHGTNLYVTALIRAAEGDRPVLAETPFSVSQIQKPLEAAGIEVTLVFVIADEAVLRERWTARGTPAAAQKGHLTRQDTYLDRAGELGAFAGTSDDVIEYLSEMEVA